MKMPVILKKVPKRYLIGGAVLFILLSAWGYYQISSFESTDDAFIDGHISPVSSQVEGRVTQVLARDNQMVHKGEILVLIDNRDYVYKRDMAQAEELSANAQLQEARKDQERYQQLLGRQEISRQEFDHASLSVKNALAQFLRAKATLDLAQLNLDRTRISAPIDGKISARTVEKGQYVQVGQPLLSVVSSEVWITANFKETQMKHMKAGNPVSIRVDAYPGVNFKGRIDSIQAGTGEVFSLLPAQNASGNYIKVVQRVPVKIMLADPNPKYPLWPGLSVTPKVDLRHTVES